MLQNRKSRQCQLELATYLILTGATITLSGNYALAQNQIVPDSTLGTESSTITPLSADSAVDEIKGGAIRGTNLFHSFLEFNVNEGRGAYFISPNANIQNILARVTGGNISEIMGTLGTHGVSSPNLFLINPNGIIFGPSARLNVGGSFVGSTASSLKFSNGTQFSASVPQTTSLLTVSVPIGLQFGKDAGRIVNRSVAVDSSSILPVGLQAPVGLQVQPGKTLALVGSDVLLPGSNLTAAAGRIELGSVAGPSLVSLFPTTSGWTLGYEDVQNFKDIQLSQGAFVNVAGEGGGDIQLSGRRVMLTDGSQIGAFTTGMLSGGSLIVNASDSVELSGFITTPNAQILTSLRTDTVASGAAGNLTINTKRLSVKDGAVISSGTSRRSTGQGGTLTVNASDSVQLSGVVITPKGQLTSGLFALTEGSGNAGNLTINTDKLSVKDGGQISVGTAIGSQGKGGNLTVTAADFIKLSGTSADGQISSGLFARTEGSGDAGNLTINTGKLIIQDKSQVTVSSVGSGEAGNLEIAARSIHLNNEGLLTAETASGNGGDITLQAQDLLLLLHNSNISTTAGTEEVAGNGGNITINTDILVALEDSNITANAFSGTGGQVEINAQGIFGTQVRDRDLPQTSDITASSTSGPELSGTVEINTLNFDPSSALASLPVEVVDVSGLIATGCPAEVGRDSSTFVYTGRGGLPPTPSEALNSDSVWVDLGTPIETQDNRVTTAPSNKSTLVAAPTVAAPPQLVEAQGWVVSDNGEIVLTATPATATASVPWLTAANCHTAKTQS